MKKYVITGATGKIGKIVSTELLAHGQKVTVIARNADKLKELVDLGAEALAGNSYDRNFLVEAFKGADAVFCLMMPDMFASDVFKEQKQIADNFYEA
ncbi:MAG: NmrA family NAD(P)-binding protein, partial [Bacteroidota bacterium]